MDSSLLTNLVVEIIFEGVVRMGRVPGVLDSLNLLDNHVRACEIEILH